MGTIFPGELPLRLYTDLTEEQGETSSRVLSGQSVKARNLRIFSGREGLLDGGVSVICLFTSEFLGGVFTSSGCSSSVQTLSEVSL